MTAPLVNRETMARQRRAGRLLFLLDLHLSTRHSVDTGYVPTPVELLTLKHDWLSTGELVERWHKISAGDPVFARRAASPMTCTLAQHALDGQLQMLVLLADVSH